MSLAEKINQGNRFEGPALPALNRLISATDRIFSRWPEAVRNPPERDREKIIQEVRDRLEKNNWEGVKLFLVTSAARALFDEDRNEKPDLEKLRQFYFDEIVASTRQGFLNAMFSVYLTTYFSDAEHTKRLARALLERVDRIGSRWQKLIGIVPKILDAGAAHQAVAELMVEMESPWEELKQIGLRSPHAPGLMSMAHFTYVELVQPTLRHRGEMERLIAWLKPEGQEAKMLGASEAITALLEHWTSKSPPAEDQTYLTETLVSLYGDPRVKRGGAWAGVSEQALGVFMRWLTGENIRFFLDVVSAVEDSHMWEPRRKFWLDLHRANRIDAAWVAFSDKGSREARRRMAGSGPGNKLAYGIQTAGGSRLNTSLLLLKVGRKIVVEGSHNYKVHIFDQNNARCPALYQRQYDCEKIRLTNGAKAQPHLGNWEGWVMENV
ncbi:MAG: EH signature domain-containing protein [Rhizobiaceae bacterium]|nr:EH signature domain-containing protein [Rhizobiaceae bacterium]